MKNKIYLCIVNIILLFCIVGVLHSQIKERFRENIIKVQPSVVMVYAYNEDGKLTQRGCGFFISDQGNIMTSWHVLKGASRAEIMLSDSSRYPIVAILAEDRECDIMRVSVDIPQDIVHRINIETSIPGSGENVIIAGSPIFSKSTDYIYNVLTVREYPSIGTIIQLNAPIADFETGCPVLNRKGEMIGMSSFQMVDDKLFTFVISAGRIEKLTIQSAKTIADWNRETINSPLAKAWDYLDKGRTLLWAGQYEVAQTWFQEAIDENDDFEQAYYQLGLCNFKLKNTQESIENFNEVLELNSQSVFALSCLGEIYKSAGMFDEALEVLKRAIKIKPDFTYAYMLIGNICVTTYSYHDAIIAFQEALKSEPNYFGAQFKIGQCYSMLGRISEAIAAFKIALAMKPENAHVWYSMGLAYHSIEQYNEALEAFTEALRLQPGFAPASTAKGLTYNELQCYPEAMDAFKEAISSNPNYAEAIYGLAVTYEYLGEDSIAINLYKLTIILDSNFVQAFIRIGFQFENLGKYQEAVAAFKNVTRILPISPDGYFFLGREYEYLGQLQDAVEVYKTAIQLGPKLVEPHYNLCLTYLLLGEKELAMDEYLSIEKLSKEKAKELLNIINQ